MMIASVQIKLSYTAVYSKVALLSLYSACTQRKLVMWDLLTAIELKVRKQGITDIMHSLNYKYYRPTDLLYII